MGRFLGGLGVSWWSVVAVLVVVVLAAMLVVGGLLYDLLVLSGRCPGGFLVWWSLGGLLAVLDVEYKCGIRKERCWSSKQMSFSSTNAVRGLPPWSSGTSKSN